MFDLTRIRDWLLLHYRRWRRKRQLEAYVEHSVPHSQPHNRQFKASLKRNVSRSPLYRLPAEILNIINQNLDSEEDSFAFALTCARFYYSDTLKKIVSSKTARFKYLCRLEDQGERWWKCCRGCLARHPPSTTFSEGELQKPPSERYCIETFPCFLLGIFPRMSFADMRNLVLAAADGPEERKRLQSFPEITIEFNLCIFPTSAHVTTRNFGRLCNILDYPICPHTQLATVVSCTIFDRRTTPELVEGWLYKSYRCERCKTWISYKLLPANTPGKDNQEWCALNVRRPLGRLYSPLERQWVSQGFAFEYPHRDECNKVDDEWFRAYWQSPSNYPSFVFEHSPTPRYTVDNIYLPFPLPFNGIDIPETLGYTPPYTVKVVSWNGMMAVEGKYEATSRSTIVI